MKERKRTGNSSSALPHRELILRWIFILDSYTNGQIERIDEPVRMAVCFFVIAHKSFLSARATTMKSELLHVMIVSFDKSRSIKRYIDTKSR